MQCAEDVEGGNTCLLIIIIILINLLGSYVYKYQ